ncbi:MAG: transporter related [Verrucomicrobiaceae bacterium]|nr:transporter related [Verrucomicrobiaceae bacterium]
MRVRSLEVGQGEVVALVGPSGAGKTTLLKLISGILEAEAGGVVFEGEDLCGLPPMKRRERRLTRMGVVFQDFALMNYLTVEENLLLPLRLGNGATAAHETKARILADKLEVSRYWHKPAAKLSQGEQQRVAIARALVHEPTLVLADEPTASLDATRKMTAARLMLDDARARGAALIMVTHDPELLPLFDRVINLEDLA